MKSRDFSEDMTSADVILSHAHDRISAKEEAFLNSIVENSQELTPRQGEWLDAIWGRVMEGR